MKKFIIKALVFMSIMFVLAYLLQQLVDKGLSQSNFSVEYKEWDDITKSKINAEIIIQGSSKAWLQISPQIFEDKFNLSTYNLGMNGQCFPMQKWRMDMYLKYNKKPKYLIQIIALREMVNPPIQYGCVQFIPYLNKSFIQRFGNNGFLGYKDLYIPLYKYCHYTGTMETGIRGLIHNVNNENNKYKGFSSMNGPWHEKWFTKVKRTFPPNSKAYIDKAAYSQFMEMINYCKKMDINLILVAPPTPTRIKIYLLTMMI